MINSYYEALLMMYMALGASDNNFRMPTKETYESLTDEEKRDLERRIKEKRKEVMLKKGLKEFTIHGITVLALNEKNAKRKVKNYLDITKL